MARADLTDLSGANRQEVRERAFRLLAVTVTALFMAFAALAALFYWYDYASRWVVHTQQMRAGIADVMQAMSDAETGQRGYLVTRDRAYLDQIERARRTGQRQAERIEKFTRDNPAQHERVRQLRPLIAQHIAAVDGVIALATQGRNTEAVALVRQGRDLQAMAGIRRLVAELDAAEAKLERERAARVGIARVAAGVTLMVFALLLGALFIKAIRDLNLDREVESEIADRLRELVSQRTLLLDEVNHRVKNSLQQIAGVVRLQARTSQNQEVREALEKTLARIMAVGRVHEQVYRAEGRLGVFDAGGYAEHLARDLVRSMGREDVKLTTSTEAALLDLSHAGPIALILNELITNALKYGCPPETACGIEVDFKSNDSGYRLSVKDAGPGVGQHFDLKGPSTLGLRAVHALARQLGGALEVVHPDRGVEFAVQFPRRAA